jgi:Asp-tRNA(Asn)/Glu-tRNA(Gln) amidotransferase A subunit family amidase
VVPISFHLDHAGAFARTLGDLAILWSVLSEEEPGLVNPPSASPPRLGVLGDYFDEKADDAVRGATRQAMSRLQAAGATVAACPLPEHFLEVPSVHRRIMAVEAAEFHRWRYARHSDQYGPNISALIEEGLSVTAVDYAAALKFQSTYRQAARGLLQGFDALVTPATTTPAPASLETTGDPAFNSPWSLAGLPTVALPCGLSPEGMPCALQLIGRWRGEGDLLKTAAWCEKELAFAPLESRL